MKTTARAGLLLAVAVSTMLTACTSGSPTTDAPAGENRPSATPTTEAPTNPTFGSSYEWSDGVSVTIGAPTAFQPSANSFANPAAAYIAFDVTIVNGSSENFDPSLFYVTLQSGNSEAEQIFDTEQGFAGGPMTTLLPGREAAFKIGFGVADPNDLVMELTPGIAYDAAIFTN